MIERVPKPNPKRRFGKINPSTTQELACCWLRSPTFGGGGKIKNPTATPQQQICNYILCYGIPGIRYVSTVHIFSILYI